jgi:hypothetical protein
MNGLPTLARLREVLHYDPATGIFTWRVALSPRGPVGTRAGTVKSDGYRKIGIDGKTYGEHRLAWLYHYGVEPAGPIDHRNTLKFDNRIANLREVTSSQNATNRNPRTKFKGVRFQAGRYHASIRTGDGQRPYLGSFATAEGAFAAYCRKAEEFHGEYRRTRMSTFETRQQLRVIAASKSDKAQNQIGILCQQLRILESHNTPAVRDVIALSMNRLRAA